MHAELLRNINRFFLALKESRESRHGTVAEKSETLRRRDTEEVVEGDRLSMVQDIIRTTIWIDGTPLSEHKEEWERQEKQEEQTGAPDDSTREDRQKIVHKSRAFLKYLLRPLPETIGYSQSMAYVCGAVMGMHTVDTDTGASTSERPRAAREETARLLGLVSRLEDDERLRLIADQCLAVYQKLSVPFMNMMAKSSVFARYREEVYRIYGLMAGRHGQPVAPHSPFFGVGSGDEDIVRGLLDGQLLRGSLTWMSEGSGYSFNGIVQLYTLFIRLETHMPIFYFLAEQWGPPHDPTNEDDAIRRNMEAAKKLDRAYGRTLRRLFGVSGSPPMPVKRLFSGIGGIFRRSESVPVRDTPETAVP